MKTVIFAFFIAASCSRSSHAGESPSPAKAIERLSNVPAPHRQMTWDDVGGNDLSFGPGVRGQLDRIDAVLASPLPMELVSAWKNEPADAGDRIRALVKDGGRATDPRMYAALAGAAVKRAVESGTIVYPLLTKNAEKYTGHPWLLVSARLRDVHETSGVTAARTELEPGSGPLMVAGRFSTPFIDGDRVDVIGYLAGEDSIAGRSVPVLAAAAILPEGTIDRINRVERLWTKALTAHTLGSLPRAM